VIARELISDHGHPSVSFHCFNSSARSCFYRDFLVAEREGLTRAFGPRPSGDACASSKIAFGDFVEPLMGFWPFEAPERVSVTWAAAPDKLYW